MRLSLGAALALALAACASAPAPVCAPLGALRIACTPDDADVYVDDSLAGSCARVRDRAMPVPAGVCRVEIRRPGFFTRYVEIDVAANRASAAELRIDLRESPEA